MRRPTTFVHDRKEAGVQLAWQLTHEDLSNTVLVANSNGGACVANAISEVLNTPFILRGEGYIPEGRTVIIIDDAVNSPDDLIDCINEINQQMPARIVVAVPFLEAESALLMESACDELYFLRIKELIEDGNEFYEDFNPVSSSQVRDLLLASEHTQKICLT